MQEVEQRREQLPSRGCNAVQAPRVNFMRTGTDRTVPVPFFV